MQIDGFCHNTADEAVKNFGIEVSPEQKNLFSCTSGGYLMVIDGTDQMLLLKVADAAR